MNKKWLMQLADVVEKRHGDETRTRIFGDIDNLPSTSLSTCHEAVAAWFHNFVNGMDALDDKEFLQQMMADYCPCGGGESGFKKRAEIYKENYDKSGTLQEFVEMTEFYDKKKLVGNVLYLTKYSNSHKNRGKCGKGCHCALARHADEYISDIFCYCCTVGHTGKPFKIAFGEDTKIEFVESLITGGKGCTMAIHLPEKEINVNDSALCEHGWNMYCEMLAAPTGNWVEHGGNYSYVAGNTGGTRLIFNVTIKEKHNEFAKNIARLIQSNKVLNMLQLAKDDTLFKALEENGFTIKRDCSMLIADITDYTSDYTPDDKITVSVVQDSDNLKHWTKINRAYWGRLYSEQQWAEIHALDNVTMYLAWYDGVPASAMMTITDGSACIELINTIPGYKKRGLATAMIKRALSDLKSNGISKVTAITGAVSLFKKVGFSVVCDKYLARLGNH